MQDWWKTLGLDAPTHDLKAVKRAYAAKLKTTRPDDDPQAFMDLRDAFEFAKLTITENLQDLPLTVNVTDTSPEAKNLSFDALPFSDTQKPTVSTHEDYPKIKEILDAPDRRNNLEVWKQYILEISRSSTLDEYTDFNNILRESLLERLGYYDENASKHNFAKEPPYIETPVAAGIFKLMDWTEPQDHGYFIEEELEWLLQDFRIIKLNRTLTGQTSSNIPANVWQAQRSRRRRGYGGTKLASIEKIITFIVIFGVIILAIFLDLDNF